MFVICNVVNCPFQGRVCLPLNSDVNFSNVVS